MFRLFLVLAASSVLFGCGSPTSPSTRETSASGDMIWIDPSATKMMLQFGGNKLYRFVTMPPRTQYVGLITSGTELVASYRGGNRIRVDVTGTAPDSTADVTARMVTAVPQLSEIHYVPKTPISYGHERTFWTSTWGNAVMIIMPWTTFDPAGDITTYEGFQAAVAANAPAALLEGEGWIVGNAVTHMRSVKITRRPPQWPP